MWYLIGSVTVVLLLVWPTVGWLCRLIFPASGGRVAGALVALTWVVTVADLVRRWLRGEPMEPEGDE